MFERVARAGPAEREAAASRRATARRAGTRDESVARVAEPTSGAVPARLLEDGVPGRATRIARTTAPPRVAAGAPGRQSRIARTTAPPHVAVSADRAAVVRRAPYLHNADSRIYRDSKQGDAELAYLGTFEFLGDAQVFVPYAAVNDLHDIAAEVTRKLPSSGSGPRTRTPYERPTARPRGKSIGGTTGFGLDLGDDYRRVSESFRDAIRSGEPASRRSTGSGRSGGRYGGQSAGRGDGDEKIHADQLLRKGLKLALGSVHGWYGGDEWHDLTADIPDKKLATIVMAVIDRGPSVMAQAGGSRLPPAQGTVYSTPPRVAAEIMRVLGVPDDKHAMYDDIAIKGLEPEDYATERDRIMATGANVFPLEDVSSGTWLFYESTATTGRSSNSRIQTAGQSFTDEEFATVDPGHDAEFVRQLATSYAALSVTPDTGWIDGTEMTASRDRGQGQAKAMKLWNALGAAAYANRFLGTAYDLAQNWEWLHVRGAQIGGQTDMGNLVPGFYTTNSAMIPFENMIKEWATSDPGRFQARFEAVGVDGAFARTIKLSIRTLVRPDPLTGEARGHVTLGEVERHLLDFDPLGGTVVDRMAGLFVKRNVDFTFRV